jgi:hypothetical protein
VQEEQKNALSIIQSKKDELETQNNMLEAQAQRRKAAHETTTDFIVTPYRSDFLKVGFLQMNAFIHLCLSSDYLQAILQAEEGNLLRYCIMKEESAETHTVTSILSITTLVIWSKQNPSCKFSRNRKGSLHH